MREAFGFEKFQQFREFLQEEFTSKIKSNSVEIKKRLLLSVQLSSPSGSMSVNSYSYSTVSYNPNTDIVIGRAVSWYEGGGGGGINYFPEFNSPQDGNCDPEHSYCWNVLVTAFMAEPDGSGLQAESVEGCDGEAEIFIYPNSEIEDGEYTVSGEHTGQQNLTSFPFCGMQGGGIDDFSNDTVTVSKPKVDIFLNGTRITNTAKNVIVGQQISLSTTVTGGTPSNPQWTIPGTKVADYKVVCNIGTYEGQTVCQENVANNIVTSATITELTNLNGSTIKYYWVDGGEGLQVKHTVTINNRPYTGKATFNVKRPTVTVTSMTSEPTVADYGDGIGLHFRTSTKAGITFSATNAVIPPTFSGEFKWVQIWNKNREIQLISRGVLTRASSIGQGLDTIDPYETGNSANDSPELLFDTNYRKVTINDSNQMYFMFTPTGLTVPTIPVPLRVVTWSWYGEASSSDGVSWTLNPNRTNTNNPAGANTTTHPEWTRNAFLIPYTKAR